MVSCGDRKYCLADGHIWEFCTAHQEKVVVAPRLTAIFALNGILFGFDGQGFVSIDTKTGRQSKVSCDTPRSAYSHVNF